MDRAEKRELVTGLNDAFKGAGSVVVAHYAGITVAQMNDLRSKMRARRRHRQSREEPSRPRSPSSGHGIREHHRSVQGTDADRLLGGSDCGAEGRLRFRQGGNDKLVILGGAMGSTSLNADGVKALATLPSLDELRAKLVGMIVAPATRIAQIVNAPAASRRPRHRRLRPEGRGGVRPFLAITETRVRTF